VESVPLLINWKLGGFFRRRSLIKTGAATLPIDLNVAIVSPWSHTAKKGGVQATVDGSFEKKE
ncbi:MAG: hypothetical protein ABF303_18170, partial [Desulfobacterales bacterium]